MIKYDPENKLYLLKDLPHGTGTFLKMSNKLVIKDKIIISFGTITFVVVPDYKLIPYCAFIFRKFNVKFLEGLKSGEVLYSKI